MPVCSAAVQDFRTAASRPTVDTHICTDSRFRPPTTSGSSATRAFRHQRLWLTMALARTSVSVDGGRLILRQDPRPSSRSPGVFGMLRLDPKTVLTLLTTTRIPGRFYRTGTVVGPRNVDDLRSCAVTSTVTTKPFFPVLDIIETEDNKTLLPHIDRSSPSGTSRSLLAHNSNYAY